MMIGQILVNKNLIKSEELKTALKQKPSHWRLGEYLVNQQLISREVLESVLKEQYWRLNGYWVIA